MKIGIIGAGNIGSALARRLTTIGHEVSIANSRGPETLQDLVAETGAQAVPATEAAKDADVVIVTIPQSSIPDLPAGLLSGAAPGAAFVDTGNYYPRHRDGRIEQTGRPDQLFRNNGGLFQFESGGRGRNIKSLAGNLPELREILRTVVERRR